jgi:hypothetical protein
MCLWHAYAIHTSLYMCTEHVSETKICIDFRLSTHFLWKIRAFLGTFSTKNKGIYRDKLGLFHKKLGIFFRHIILIIKQYLSIIPELQVVSYMDSLQGIWVTFPVKVYILEKQSQLEKQGIMWFHTLCQESTITIY